MYGSLGSSILSLKKFFQLNGTTIDNRVFKLHYRISCLLLIVCCLIVSTRQLFGEEIACYLGHKDIIPSSIINTYCWIQSTFTVETQPLDKSILSPGVRTSNENDKRTYYKYYQWVGLCLFIQAVIFYLPHFLWKISEANKMNTLRQDLHVCFHTPEDDDDSETPDYDNRNRILQRKRTKWDRKVASLADYFIIKKGSHVCYAFSYFGCELLNLLLTLLQVWLLDKFLGNEFLSYGYEVLKFVQMDQQDRHDPMILIFPRMSKCVFRHYGPSGELQIQDALCVLPLNIANEKIYVVIWFWMVFLAIISTFMVLYRIPIILHSHFRTVFAIRFYSHAADLTKLAQIYKVIDVGDWLLLKRLSQNINGEHFRHLIDLIYARMVDNETIKLQVDVEKQRLRKDEGDITAIPSTSSGERSKPKQIRKMCCC